MSLGDDFIVLPEFGTVKAHIKGPTVTKCVSTSSTYLYLLYFNKVLLLIAHMLYAKVSEDTKKSLVSYFL